MITLYLPEPLPEPRSEPPTTARPVTRISSRRAPPESFLNELEAKRYDFLASQFTDLDRPVLAQMCANWAREHRLTITRLAEVERRIADLDRELYPHAKGDRA